MKENKLRLFIPIIAATLLASCGPVNQPETPHIEIAALNGIKYAQTSNDSYQLTATITPEYAYNKKVNWAISWDSSEASTTDDDAFKTGKTVTEYVTITASGENNDVATVKLVKAFGSQILITASADQNPTITATATVNYLKKYTPNIITANAKFTPTDVSNKFTHPISDTPLVSVGTKAPTAEGKMTYKYGAAFYKYDGKSPIKYDSSTVKVHNYNGSESKYVVNEMARRLSNVTTKTVDFDSLSRGWWSNEYDYNKSYLKQFYMALFDAQTGNYKFYFPYAAYLDGVQVFSGSSNPKVLFGSDGITWELAQIDLSSIASTLNLNMSLSDSDITFI